MYIKPSHENHHFPALKHFPSCRKAVLKIKSTALLQLSVNNYEHPVARGGPHLSWYLRLFQTSMPLHSASAILLKLKRWSCIATRGEHLPRYARRLAAQRNCERCPYILSKEKEDRKIKLRRKERTIHDENWAVLWRWKFGMVTPLIADIANHITNLIGKTISLLALPDKSSGFCSIQKGKSRAEKIRPSTICWD